MANTLINNKVLGDTIGAELPTKLKFAPVAEVGTKLTSVAGDTLVVEKYSYIGEAVDVAEGAAIPISDLSMGSTEVTVKKAGKGIKLTDEEVIRRGQEVINEGKKQLSISITDKIDSDSYAALKTAQLKYEGHKADEIIGYEGMVNAIALFGDEDIEDMAVYISPLQRAQLQLDPNFIRASDLGDQVLTTGVIGSIAGVQVIVSNKVKKATKDTKSVFHNPIVKKGGLGIELAKAVNIEEDRSPSTKSSEYYADEHYVAYLRDSSKVVLATFLEEEESAVEG